MNKTRYLIFKTALFPLFCLAAKILNFVRFSNHVRYIGHWIN